MRACVMVMLISLWSQGSVNSIRLLELRVPAHASAGGEALLGCTFDLEDDLLYSVSWYKDGSMFYRYMPKPGRTKDFPLKGVTVDMSRSSSDVVTLTNLTTDSAGVYRCEVVGDAPGFSTVASEHYITIYILPETSPRVTGMQYSYAIDDIVSVNCTSAASRPEAQLTWLINGRPAPKKYLQGPWRRAVDDPPDTTETTLGMRFKVAQKHFKKNAMELKCQATIAPLYQREQVHSVLEPGSPYDKNGQPITTDHTEETNSNKYTKIEEDLKNELIKTFKDTAHTFEIPEETTEDPTANGKRLIGEPVVISVLLMVLLY